MQKNNAYEEGFNAFLKNPSAKNPHRLMSEPWDLWQRGFNTAKYGEVMSRIGNYDELGY